MTSKKINSDFYISSNIHKNSKFLHCLKFFIRIFYLFLNVLPIFVPPFHCHHFLMQPKCLAFNLHSFLLLQVLPSSKVTLYPCGRFTQPSNFSFLSSTSAKHSSSHTEEFIHTKSHSSSKNSLRSKYPIFSDLLEDPKDFSFFDLIGTSGPHFL